MKMIKVDFLGLGMMAVMKDCIDLVPKHYGVSIDLAQLPDDDLVYEMLRMADTIGLSGGESGADVGAGAESSEGVLRPGRAGRPHPPWSDRRQDGEPLYAAMLRRQGREQVTYPHPLLELVLERTLGVPLFQEQLIRIAMVIANFSGGEAEELRRAMGMRRSKEKMYQLEKKLSAGMTAKGVAPAAQKQIIQSIASFALYGFPESHAASLALIAYASAYLKRRYLAAFTCALLNNQPMGFYSPATLVKDAQRHGLKVLHIDVQHSDWTCTLESLKAKKPHDTTILLA